MQASSYKLFILLLCPVTLVVGHILSFRFSDRLQFEINKDGWLNAFFVKRGWFWTSLIGWWCIIRYRSFSSRNRNTLVRYLILTVWWFLFTQGVWFGVAPIMDLIFLYTGGHCNFNVFDTQGNVSAVFHDTASRRTRSLRRIYELLKKSIKNAQHYDDAFVTRSLNSIKCALGDADCKSNDTITSLASQELNSFIHDTLCSENSFSSSAACRSLGGYWIGGHDPSGHIFLITLMIMYLLGELNIFGRRAFARLFKKDYRPLKSFIKLFDNGPLWNIINMNPQNAKEVFRVMFILPPLNFLKDLLRFTLESVKFVVVDNPVIMLVGLLIMWWWSFLVTTVVFHTLSEQISGLAFAYLVAGLIYWNDNWFIHNAMH